MFPRTAPNMNVEEFLKIASAEDAEKCVQFVPKPFVAAHFDPHKNVPFIVYAARFKYFACVLCLIYIPGIAMPFVLITAEWKGGNDRITIVQPCGTPNPEEIQLLPAIADYMRATGFRECEEELGITPGSLISLSGNQPIYSIVRNADVACFPYLAEFDTPLIKGKTKLDASETLEVVLFPLDELIKLVTSDTLFAANPTFGLEACTRDTLFAGLHKLGMMNIAYY